MLQQIKRNSVVFCDVADDLVALHQIHGGLEDSYIRPNGDISCSRDGCASRAN